MIKFIQKIRKNRVFMVFFSKKGKKISKTQTQKHTYFKNISQKEVIFPQKKSAFLIIEKHFFLCYFIFMLLLLRPLFW